jgi:hypothetical protein
MTQNNVSYIILECPRRIICTKIWATMFVIYCVYLKLTCYESIWRLGFGRVQVFLYGRRELILVRTHACKGTFTNFPFLFIKKYFPYLHTVIIIIFRDTKKRRTALWITHIDNVYMRIFSFFKFTVRYSYLWRCTERESYLSLVTDETWNRSPFG